MARSAPIPPETHCRPRGGASREAFTLVELLVVIGIIAVLIGILLPTLSKAREQARETACQSNLRQWGMGFNIYADSSKGLLPDDGEDGNSTSEAIRFWDAPWMWFNAVPKVVIKKTYDEMQRDHLAGVQSLPFEGENNLFVCPSSTRALGVSASETTDGGYYRMFGTTLAAPSSVEMRETFACYVFNSKLMSDSNPTLRISKLRPASEYVLMVEKRMRRGELSNTDPNRNSSLNRFKADRKRFTARHRAGGYLLFADGHVGWVSNREVNTAVRSTLPNGAIIADYNRPGVARWNPYGFAD